MDSGSEFLGRDFCAEHDSRFWAVVSRLALWIGLMLILLWFINDFWAYCTVTDPEYLERFFSP